MPIETECYCELCGKHHCHWTNACATTCGVNHIAEARRKAAEEAEDAAQDRYFRHENHED